MFPPRFLTSDEVNALCTCTYEYAGSWAQFIFENHGPGLYLQKWIDSLIKYTLPLSTSASSGRTESIKSVQCIPDMRRKNKAEIHVFGLVLDTCTTRIRAIPDAKNQKEVMETDRKIKYPYLRR